MLIRYHNNNGPDCPRPIMPPRPDSIKPSKLDADLISLRELTVIEISKAFGVPLKYLAADNGN